MHWWYDDGSWWGWILMTAGMLAFWSLVAWLVVSVLRSPRTSGRVDRSSAEQLLDERFAAGDIDESDYRARRDALQPTGASIGARRNPSDS